MIHEEDCLGTMVYMENPIEKGMKLITGNNEIFINDFVYQVLEKIKEYAPIPVSQLLKEMHIEYPQKNKEEFYGVIEQLLKFEVVEIIEDVW